MAEREGAVKHGAKMIQAVANARVPKFTVVIGGSFGAGNYGMCGRGFSPRFIFAWPSARTAVMGGEQAARVMEMVERGKAAREGRAVDEAALAAMSARIREGIDAQSDALFATARLWDDGIIDPRETRAVLGLCLTIAAEAERVTLRPNTFGVARGGGGGGRGSAVVASCDRRMTNDERRATNNEPTEHNHAVHAGAQRDPPHGGEVRRERAQSPCRRMGGGGGVSLARGVQEARRSRPARHQVRPGL